MHGNPRHTHVRVSVHSEHDNRPCAPGTSCRFQRYLGIASLTTEDATQGEAGLLLAEKTEA